MKDLDYKILQRARISYEDFHKFSDLDREFTPVAPHCDPAILHAPSKCEYCDEFPYYQSLRELWGINFTGENDPEKLKCPAEARRDFSDLNMWHGNKATTSENDLDWEFPGIELDLTAITPEEFEKYPWYKRWFLKFCGY